MQTTCSIALAAGLLAAAASAQVAPRLVYPEGAEVPRYMTDEERLWVLDHPLDAERGATPPPTGDPIHCAAEYEPMDGIIVGWEGSSAWLNILAQLGAQITTTGDAKFYVITDVVTEPADATNRLTSFGANMANVVFLTRTLDSIWMRDYGPRYIFIDDVRAIVDHTYNRPRPNDNLFPTFFAQYKNHARYEIPLVHGGGNYHLDGVGRSYATRLINNENPALTEQQIVDLWEEYQNVDTTLRNPFPTSVDATQHIDMWMQVAGDNLVFISDWPNNPGSTQDVICDQTAALLAGQGYTVVRLNAYSTSGTHYTFTNMVMCNDVVLVPQYNVNPAFSYNATAVATIQAALPGKTVVPVNGQAIVTSAGVFHCIVMHVPAHRGGLNPTAYVSSPNGGLSFDPSDSAAIDWLSDDDELVSSIRLEMSADGGATWPFLIAPNTAPDGTFNWTIPDVTTQQAVFRVTAIDAGGRTGADVSDGFNRIAGSCIGDTNGDNERDFADLNNLLNNFGQSAPSGSYLPGDINGEGVVDFNDLNLLLGGYGMSCN